MQVSKLPGKFGVAVNDINLARASDAEVHTLIDLLHEHQIIAIQGQELQDADYVRFGQHWGTPLHFFISSLTRDDFPELIKQANRADTPKSVRDGAGHWHSDSTYEEVPASVTMLYGVEAPEVGGETLIANTRMAYEALDDAMKARIDTMIGKHCLSGSPPLPGETIVYVAEEIARMGIQHHPLVMRHPVTGAKSIYTSGSAFGVEGMDKAEGKAMINDLRMHCTRPEFVTQYKIMPGDLFIWDNFQTMHSATKIEYSDEDGKRRLLYRLSTKGLPRHIAQEAAAA